LRLRLPLLAPGTYCSACPPPTPAGVAGSPAALGAARPRRPV